MQSAYYKSVETGLTTVAPETVPSPPANAPAPAAATSAYAAKQSLPLHTQTQSTLAPTSEYVRYLLLALPARYVPRGMIGTLFETKHFDGNALGRGLAKTATWFQSKFPKTHPDHAYGLAYNAIMGVGSLALTASYSHTVYKDVRNIFAEAVAMETGKDPATITWADLKASDNRIVQKTVDNFWKRTGKRLVTDALFFPAAAARSAPLGDLMVGMKAAQAFTETWKRKTTMFEDMVTFINNKINPRNGLGQAIGVGEVFDLYQHYSEAFNPQQMFTNVLEHGGGEGHRWAESQPIFARMTELMNLTYAYKHKSVIDPHTGREVAQADFGLPKFTYLLGHDLIDIAQPKKTLVTIEIANRFGIQAVKEMQTMLRSGASLEQVTQRFPVELRPATALPPQPTKNGVIAKGSTMQLDVADTLPDAPTTTVDAGSILAERGLEGQQALLLQRQ